MLALGKLSAGKLVATPGMPSYATDIFTQMHYGVTNELAARCILLLALVAAGGCGVALLSSIISRRNGETPHSDFRGAVPQLRGL